MSRRPIDKIVADLLDAVGAASELVGRGRDAYDNDRLLRLAGEAVIGRIGDSAANSETNTAMTSRERCPGMTSSLTGSSSITSTTGSTMTSSGTPSNATYPRSVPG